LPFILVSYQGIFAHVNQRKALSHPNLRLFNADSRLSIQYFQGPGQSSEWADIVPKLTDKSALLPDILNVAGRG
jgi:hypothetical protein